MLPRTIRVRRVGDHALAPPTRHTADAAGFDLQACIEEPMTIAPGARAVVPTGWAWEIQHGYEGQVRPRSSGSKNGVDVALGTVDADYRGEVSAVVVNNTGAPLEILPGRRIAQLVIAPVMVACAEEVQELSETGRGAGGWGSTGQ